MSPSDSGQRLPKGDPGKDTMSEVAGERCHIVSTGPGAELPPQLCDRACPALPAEDPGVCPTGNHMVSSKTS